MKKVLFLLLTLGATPAVAQVSNGEVTIQLDAGELTGPNGASTLVPDNDYGSPNGSLLLILDLGSSGTVDNTLAPGNYVSGTNVVLGAGGFNNNSGSGDPNETENTIQFTIPAGVATGSDLALRWFPQITLAEFEAGTVPAGGDSFGTFNPNGGAPDGGSLWVLPSGGSTINLQFNTENDLYQFQPGTGGTEPASAGYADFQVTGGGSTSSVPEPSTSLLMLLGLPVIFWAARRLRLVASV